MVVGVQELVISEILLFLAGKMVDVSSSSEHGSGSWVETFLRGELHVSVNKQDA